MNIQAVPRGETSPVLVIKTSQLMLYREIIAVCSEIHTKHINTYYTVWVERRIAAYHKATAGIYCRRVRAIGREKHVASVVVVVFVTVNAAIVVVFVASGDSYNEIASFTPPQEKPKQF
jgi:L-amino acid N-acyltransferase YncA